MSDSNSICVIRDVTYSPAVMQEMQVAYEAWDWEQFRRKTSAMVLAGMSGDSSYQTPQSMAKHAIERTDELIRAIRKMRLKND